MTKKKIATIPRLVTIDPYDKKEIIMLQATVTMKKGKGKLK